MEIIILIVFLVIFVLLLVMARWVELEAARVTRESNDELDDLLKSIYTDKNEATRVLVKHKWCKEFRSDLYPKENARVLVLVRRDESKILYSDIGQIRSGRIVYDLYDNEETLVAWSVIPQVCDFS